MNQWQPWQWPIDDASSVRVETFHHSLNGRRLLWEAFVIPIVGKDLSHVLLRYVEGDGVFAVCDSYGNLVQARLTESSDAWSVRMVGADALNKGKVARLFCLGDSGQLLERGEAARKLAIIRANGKGMWSSWANAGYNGDKFMLFDDDGIESFMGRPTLEIWKGFQDVLQDPQSDAAFARDWMDMSEAQRENAVWNWEVESRTRLRAEVEELLKCVLLSHEALWQGNESWGLSLADPENMWLYPEEEWEEHDIPDEVRGNIEEIWRYYAPFDAEVLKHECAFDWRQGAIKAFQVEAREPTAHERLEAMLRLRDWFDEAREQEGG
ncbi:hypothetical protein EON83_01340 [bacterium]|nr:MAG: hypothetical protein EON83_01340 [bacterium]